MPRRLLRLLWYFVAALVVIAAILSSAARFLFPVMGAYRSDVETWVSQRIGEPVHIGSLQTTWRGVDPVIRFGHVRVLDEQTGRVLLAARELRVSLNLWASIRAGHPVPGGMTVVGTRLDLVQLASGRVVLRGFEDRPMRDLPLAGLLKQRQAAIVQSTIRWTEVGKATGPLQFGGVSIRLRNDGDHHTLNGKARLPSALGQTVRFSAQLTGALDRPRQWHGMMYMRGRGLHLGAWPTDNLTFGRSLSGIADLSLWASVSGSRLTKLSGVVAARSLRIVNREKAGDGALRLSQLGGRFRWMRAAHGWRLDVDRLRVGGGGRDLPPTAVSLAFSSIGDSKRVWRARVGYADLGFLHRLVNVTGMLSGPRLHMLDQLAPVGTVHGLQFALMESAGKVRQLGFRVRFDRLGIRQWRRYPALSGLNGAAQGNLDHGTLVLDSTGASFNEPRWFAAPLSAEKVAGTLHWQRFRDRLRVQTGRMDVYTRDLRTRSRVRVDFPVDGGSPVIDMETAFGQGNIAHVDRYLPSGIMPKHTVQWLQRALVGGRVSSGVLLLHGRLAKFPFRRNQGVFQVSFNVRNATLDYLPDWPPITQLRGHVDFVGTSMRVQAAGGKMLGAQLKNIQAGIVDLQHPALTVSGTASGQLSAMLDFLRTSPLGQGYRDILGRVQSKGNAALDLSLNVPLHGEHRKVVAKGSLQLPGNVLAFTDSHAELEKLRGTLNFDGDALSAKGVKAELFGRPVGFSVSSKRGKSGVMRTQVQLTGRLGLVDRLRKSGGMLAKQVSGATDWRLLLAVPGAGGAVGPLAATVKLESDLRGVAVDLPAPLGKAAHAKRALTLQATVSAHHVGPVMVSYGKALRARLAVALTKRGLKIQRGEIRFGTRPASLPTSTGLRIAGYIPRLSVPQWLADPRWGWTAGHAGSGVLVRSVDLRVGELNGLGQRFGDTRIEAHRSTSSWIVDLTGARVDGRIIWPLSLGSHDRVAMSFQRLALDPVVPVTGSAAAAINPARIPPLDVSARRLVYGGVELGQLKLSTVPEASGLQVQKASLISDWLQLHAHGDWQVHNGLQTSHFRMRIAGGNLGKMLGAFGYAGNITGGQTRGEIKAHWRGSPMAFSLRRLQGHLHLHIGEGRILRVEPGAAGRVFGLLSLQALPRRLSLDFSDLFRKGFSFDAVDGNFTLHDGNAYTSDLTVDGPSARIEIVGRIGLAARDYDQLVTVIPQIRSSLPLAGIIAGGPPVGAALFLMNKLFPGPMTELTSLADYKYTLTGSWDHPVVKRLGARSAARQRSPGE